MSSAGALMKLIFVEMFATDAVAERF